MKFIQNYYVPICKDCIYFHSFIAPPTCTLIGTKNIINGNIKYMNAMECRKDETKCGYIGKFYNSKKKYNLPIIKFCFLLFILLYKIL